MKFSISPLDKSNTLSANDFWNSLSFLQLSKDNPYSKPDTEIRKRRGGDDHGSVAAVPAAGRAAQVGNLLLLQEVLHEEQAADEPRLPQEAQAVGRRRIRFGQLNNNVTSIDVLFCLLLRV